MVFTRRTRRFFARTVLLGALGLAVVTGSGMREASAAKVMAIDCNQLYATAIYAGNQYLAASRRGDTVTADFWWSIYNRAELTYAFNCMGDSAA
jgi:hypothetical protein